MARSWTNRLTRRPGEVAAQAAQDGAVAAFLDLDTRQSYVADCITALAELAGPGEATGAAAALTRAWAPTAQQCLLATGEYLQVSDQHALNAVDGRPTGTDQVAAQAAFSQVHRNLAAAAAAVDAFYQAHSSELEHAKSARAATPQIAEEARAAAGRAEQAIARAQDNGTAYASVQDGVGELVRALTSLRTAESAGRIAAVRAAAAEVHAAATHVVELVDKAAGLLATVRSAQASVRTRIEAVSTRLAGLPAVRSALLREFSTECSRDLQGTDDRARASLAQARLDWERAGQVMTADPEEAARQLASARSRRAAAEADQGALVERLRVLRETQADPRAAAGRVHFRLHDAQVLVVDNGLVKEWGSVLDAQVARIDRAVADLTGTHPNYWAYLESLAAVESFVKGVVDRVRSQIR